MQLDMYRIRFVISVTWYHIGVNYTGDKGRYTLPVFTAREHG